MWSLTMWKLILSPKPSSWESYSISILLLNHMCITPKERLQGALVFCTKQKSISKKAQWKHYIMLLYIHISPVVFTVWGNTFNSVLEPLIVLQKGAIRIVCGALKFDHTYPLFQLSKILPLRNLYVYSAQLFLYKYYRQSLPNIFSGFFTINETIHNHYTRQIEHFHTHLAKSSQRARTLRCTGVKINNYFMNRLNYNCSDGVYKQKLKEHILMNDISHLYGGTR